MINNFIAAAPAGWIAGIVGALCFGCLYAALFALIWPVAAAKTLNRLGLSRAAGKIAARGQSREDKRRSIQQQIKAQDQRAARGPNMTLAERLEATGVETSLPQAHLMGLSIGIALAGLMIASNKSLYVSLAMLPLLGWVLPRWWMNGLIVKRQRRFIEELPNAIDVLVRGVRTGLPVNEGLKLIAREIPAPVGPQFAKLSDEISVGMKLDDALRRLNTRMPLPEVNFFAIVLIIQRQTGGNLAEALGNLSHIIRDRKKLKNKIRALSSEAKASSMIIGSLPFLLGLVLMVIKPDHMNVLFSTVAGNWVMGGGLLWMGMGIVVMREMIKIDI